MTIDEMIAVLEAAKAGKSIEARVIDDSKWYTAATQCWDFCDIEYRVKPEPRVLWVSTKDLANDKQDWFPAHRFKSFANPGFVKFVEVLDD